MKKELLALEGADIIQPGKFHPSLFNVNLHIYEKEMLAVTCDTLSQKNAFVNALSGEGTITGSIRFSHCKIRCSQSANIFRQHFSVIKGGSSLLSTLSVAENISSSFLDKLFIPYKSIHEQARQLMEEFHCYINLAAYPSDLTSREAIIVALFQAYMRQKKIIILVDLSQYLPDRELEEIYLIIHQMQQKGPSFLIIDTYQPYLIRWANDFLLIKNNTVLACFESSFVNYEKIKLYLLSGEAGHSRHDPFFPEYYDNAAPDSSSEVIFSFHHLYTRELTDISFYMHKGELIKIFSYDQYSFDGIYKLLTAQSPIYNGTVNLYGQKIGFASLNPIHKKEIFWCPESPYVNLLINGLSVRDNLLSILSSKSGKIHLSPSFVNHIDQYIRENLDIDDPSIMASEFPIPKRLEIALTKIIILAPKVVFFYRPFLETDLLLKDITISIMKKLQKRGSCIIILTSSVHDLRELDGNFICLKRGKPDPDNDLALIRHDV